MNHISQEIHRIDKDTFAHSHDYYRFLWVHRYNVFLPFRNHYNDLHQKKNNMNIYI